MQVAKRSNGSSSIAMAAYRSGEKLFEERTGETKHYKRKVQPETMILAPKHAPSWVQNRNRLWNEVEKAEKRVDAQLCREFNLALPKELNKEEQRKLIHDFCKEQLVDRGMIADIAIHRDDEQNPHAHVMLTMRDIKDDGFGKKNRDWNDKELMKSWREEWANYANRSLERAGFSERIDHRSLAEQGIDRIPTIHEGPKVREMEERGVTTDRGDLQREIREINRKIIELEKYREEKEKQAKTKTITARVKQPVATVTDLSRYTSYEKPIIRKAEKIIGGPVSSFSIEQKMLDLGTKERELSLKQEKIGQTLERFERANSVFKELEEHQQELDKMNLYQRRFSHKAKDIRNEIKNIRENLKEMGFLNKEKFDERFNKTLEYTNNDKKFIERRIKQIDKQQGQLQEARKVVLKAEQREKERTLRTHSLDRSLQKEQAVSGRPIGNDLTNAMLQSIKKEIRKAEREQDLQRRENDRKREGRRP